MPAIPAQPADRPLVTFAVIAYNQERFIREAVEGAFAQTYEPLEILLSDDCSPDRTYAIMQEMAAAYTGPHKVVLNRNEPNLGLVGHLNKVVEKSTGKLIFLNAGDDVSTKERVKVSVSLWKSENNVKLIHSSAMRMTEEGVAFGIRTPPDIMQSDPTPKDIIKDANWVIGATAAIDRSVFDTFGKLGEDLTIEDHILPFQASIIGKLIYTDTPLVKHRTGGITKKIMSGLGQNYLYGGGLKSRRWELETDLHIIRNFQKVEIYEKEDIMRICENRSIYLRYLLDCAESSRAPRILMIFRATWLSFLLRNLKPLKCWMWYNFDFIYIPYANWNIPRRLRRSGRGSAEAPQ